MPRQFAASSKKHLAEGKRFPLNMRTTGAVRRLLETAARRSGRSLAQEVEFRIEQSFDREALLALVSKAIKPSHSE